MILYTPKVGRLIAFEGFVNDHEREYYRDYILGQMRERGASDVMRHIIDDCTVETPDEEMRGIRFETRAIVMTEKEFREAINDAYIQGLRAATGKKS